MERWTEIQEAEKNPEKEEESASDSFLFCLWPELCPRKELHVQIVNGIHQRHSMAALDPPKLKNEN